MPPSRFNVESYLLTFHIAVPFSCLIPAIYGRKKGIKNPGLNMLPRSFKMNRCLFRPSDRIFKYDSVCCRPSAEAVFLCLNHNIEQILRRVVAPGSGTFRSDPDYRSFPHFDHFPIYLKLAGTFDKNV
jgi:hypothetical protein